MKINVSHQVIDTAELTDADALLLEKAEELRLLGVKYKKNVSIGFTGGPRVGHCFSVNLSGGLDWMKCEVQ